jgi:uncharacterized protein (DUF1800 family)
MTARSAVRGAPLGACLAITMLFVSPARAQAPPEVQGLTLMGPSTLAWSSAGGAASYDVYRGDASGLRSGSAARCHAYHVGATTLLSAAPPAPGDAFFYLVTGESAAGAEGTAGNASSGAPRPLRGRCGPVMRNHVLNRLGYGWSEWGRDRIAALGSLSAYIDEQLNPSSISEADNTDLNSRLTAIDPPDNVTELIARQIVGGVYARRQLAEQAASFWTNHFNTENRKIGDQFKRLFPPCNGSPPPPQCDPAFPARSDQEASATQDTEFDTFQDLAFYGRFRDLLGASAKSPAMIVFLDTISNVVGAPNENYAREVLELYSMGVDGGYTQTDVEQLARVFTGWTFCRKSPSDASNPLAPCIATYWDAAIPGTWAANFLTAYHDCGSKTLFAGTPQQLVLASTCGNPAAQVQELETALDAIAAHPSTRAFISRKILEKFVSDDPDPSMVDALVAEWNDASNPHGVGDMREVLRAALALPVFLDPDHTGSKAKTPLEHDISAFRAVRGRTNGSSQVFNYLTQAQYLPYLNTVPTGWSEKGDDWIDTYNLLVRQNFGIALGSNSGTNFGSDPLALLTANGVPTAPGNAAAIVDFLVDAMMAGALTPAERQKAIDFLNTDDSGVPSNYNNARIRDLVGFLLGYAQFQEQ